METGTISSAEILFEVNTDGILTVSYKDEKKDDVIRQEFGRCARVMSRKEITTLKEEAEIHKKDDMKETQRLKAKNNLLITCVNIRYKMDNDEKLQPLLDKAARTKIEDTCETVTNWVRSNETEDAAAFKKKKEEYVVLLKNLQIKNYE